MKKVIIITIISTLFLLACNKEQQQENLKINSSGRAGEILVVIDDYRWNTEIGDTIFQSLSSPFENLPQDEAFYRVMHTSFNNFKNVLTRHRNILIIKIDKNLKNEIIIKNDTWAYNQLVVQVNAPDDSSFVTYWLQKNREILKLFFDEDIKRFQQLYSKYLNKNAIEKIKDKFSIVIDIPSDYNLDVIKDNFCWISKETPKSSQGILIYTYPLTDTLQLVVENIIKKRDQILKENVPGPKDGTYMQTEKRIDFKVEKIEISGRPAKLIRGLWYIENYYLGGPFVCIVVPDIERKRIVVVDAYIYGGKEDKKMLVWQTEAIIKTLKLN